MEVRLNAGIVREKVHGNTSPHISVHLWGLSQGLRENPQRITRHCIFFTFIHSRPFTYLRIRPRPSSPIVDCLSMK